MKKVILKIIAILILLVLVFTFMQTSLISIATETTVEDNDKIEERNQIGFSEDDFLTTKETKIVNKKGEEIILRGYNIGLWLSRSFWGLPVSMNYNEDRITENGEVITNRYSPVNSIEMDYELFSNKKLTEAQVNELNDLFYKNQIKEKDIQIIAETGANLVRVPFEWSFFMRPVYDASKDDGNKHDADYNNYGALSYRDTTLETATTEDKEFLNKRLEYLRWIVNECKERKIYVIFDLHVAPGGLNAGGHRDKPYFFEKGDEGKARRDCALRIWKIVAGVFKNEPTVAGYDIINEASCFNNGESNLYINVIDFYDEAYEEIRKIDDQHIIIMEGKVKSYSNSNVEIKMDKTCEGLPNPKDRGWTNVIYSKHDYFFNFRNGTEDENMNEEWQKDNPNIEIMKARIDNSIKETEYLKNEYKIPVWIGEFSCHGYYNDKEGNVIGTFQDNNNNRFTLNKEYTNEIWNYQIEKYENNNISYAAWTYKACWEKYFGLIYYGRKKEINRIDLKTSTYEEIRKLFSCDSETVMNYNTEFHNIMKNNLKIFYGVDISVNGDGNIIAKLSNDKTTLTIIGNGEMTNFSDKLIGDCEEYVYSKETVAPWNIYKENITTVIMDGNITNIGKDAFLNCNKLKDIKIGESVKTIGAYAFHNCSSLTGIKIFNSVTNINMGAFYKCENLNWIELGKEVSYIGKEVFTGCRKLKNIYIYESNQNYAAISGVLYNKDKTKIIKYPQAKEDKEFIISSKVTSIEEKAFEGTCLTSIIIPKEVTEIGTKAFENCINLTITCKEGTKIEMYAKENNIPYILDKGFPNIQFTTNGTSKTVISTTTKIEVTDIGTGVDYENLKYYWGTRSEGVKKDEIKTLFSINNAITTPKQEGTYYLWILARDKVGNEKIQRSNGFKIDAIAPVVTVEESTNGKVYIKANEEIQEINGWTLLEDKKTITKTYKENTTDVVEVKDLLGNVTRVNISITNIENAYFNINIYKIEDDYILRIKPKTTYENFVKNINTNQEYIIKENEKIISEKDIIKTGQKLITGEKEYILVVTADLNGDGKISVTDISKMKKHIIKNELLQNCYEKATDINGDGKTSITDIAMMKKVLVGIDEL